jgi:archaellum component FlaC
MTDLSREIGMHNEAIGTLKEEVKALREDIAEIKQILAMNRGGVRTLLAVGSIAASFAAGITEFLHWVHKGP